MQQVISSACEKQCKAKNVFQLEKGRRNEIIFEEHFIRRTLHSYSKCDGRLQRKRTFKEEETTHREIK